VGRDGINPEFVARVVVDAELTSNEAAAEQHGISPKTVSRYRALARTDAHVAGLCEKLRQGLGEEWIAKRKAELDAHAATPQGPPGESLLQFIERVSPPAELPVPWHLRELIALLERAITSRVFAIVCMPPRHGKTTTVRRALAWAVLKYPDRLNAFGTYSGDYAKKHSRAIQNLVKSQGLKLQPRAQQLAQWLTPEEGGLLAQGREGQWTGQGIGGICVLDDLLKNRKEAESVTIRETAWDILTNDIYTRMQPPNGSLFLVNTRWHEDDPTGRLIKLSGTNGFPVFEVLNLPALRDPETGDPSDKPNAIALWPERFPVVELKARRTVLGPYAWNALFQGSPTPEQGTIFQREWFKNTWITLPRGGYFVQSWDMAFALLDESVDFVVGQLWYVHGVNFYLVDQVAEKLNFAGTIEAMRACATNWPDAMLKLVEAKANGPNIVKMLKKEIAGLKLVPPADNASKKSRAFAVQGLFSAGNVFMPHPQLAKFRDGSQGAPWLAEYMRNMLAFPSGGVDDPVDATTQVLNFLAPSDSDLMEKAMDVVFAKRCSECGEREGTPHLGTCAHAPKPRALTQDEAVRARAAFQRGAGAFMARTKLTLSQLARAWRGEHMPPEQIAAILVAIEPAAA
jgi:predicted phage terminase large subunit-like protein